MHFPIAFSPGHHRRAAVALTMTTGALPARSLSVNDRPAMCRVPIVLKNCAVTVLTNGHGSPIVVGTESRPGRMILVPLLDSNGIDVASAALSTPGVSAAARSSCSYIVRRSASV
jgi:hypothetical protein